MILGGSKAWEVWSIHGNSRVRVHGKGAVVEHTGSKIAHDGFGLDMEVAQHLIGAPASDQSDDVGINLGTKKGHGAGGAKGPGGNVGGEEAIERAQNQASSFESGADLG